MKKTCEHCKQTYYEGPIHIPLLSSNEEIKSISGEWKDYLDDAYALGRIFTTSIASGWTNEFLRGLNGEAR